MQFTDTHDAPNRKIAQNCSPVPYADMGLRAWIMPRIFEIGGTDCRMPPVNQRLDLQHVRPEASSAPFTLSIETILGQSYGQDDWPTIFA